jgi:hypothetical protein
VTARSPASAKGAATYDSLGCSWRRLEIGTEFEQGCGIKLVPNMLACIHTLLQMLIKSLIGYGGTHSQNCALSKHRVLPEIVLRGEHGRTSTCTDDILRGGGIRGRGP